MGSYFWLALGWSVLGFIVGFTTCWLWTCSIPRKSIEDERSSVSRHRFLSGQNVIGFFILLLLIFASIRYYQTTDCQTRYNEAVSNALAETSEARGKETLAEANKAQAQLLYLRTLVNNPGDRQQGRAATDQYLRTLEEHIAALQELERVRKEHPMPVPANCR